MKDLRNPESPEDGILVQGTKFPDTKYHQADSFRVEYMSNLPPTHQRDLKVMFRGDDSCSLTNMNWSCFASEYCNSGGFPSSMDVTRGIVVEHGQRIVAFANIESCSTCTALKIMFPNVEFVSEHGFLSSLCIHNDFRKNGLVKRVIDVAKRTFPKLALTVARPHRTNNSVEVERFMTERHDTLCSLYTHLGFRWRAECANYTLMID